MFFQRFGVDTSVLRQYLQTAVEFIRLRSDPGKVKMGVRISGGRRFIGARVFLSWSTVFEMDGNLSIAWST